ncbi:MAG: M17 family peptidase N-terminal domain-containing protein, partial [Nitriliruptoraceae bacterium]
MADLPDVHITTDDIADLDVDALIVPVFRGGIEGPGADVALRALGLDDVPRDHGFRGKTGEVLHLAAPGQPWGRVTLVGLGRLDSLSDEMLRRAAGSAVRSILGTAHTAATTLALVEGSAEAVRAVAEGAMLGAYRYDEVRTDPAPRTLTDVTVVVASSLAERAAAAVGRAGIHARAQCLARDVVTTPPDRLGPVEVAELALERLPDSIEVEIWDEQRLADEGCGGHLAVGRGSARPPRLVRLRYVPDDPVATVALVGKGITFDTGGISLK